MRDRNDRETRYFYDGLSRLRKIMDANTKMTEYDYDKAGNRTLIKDAEENETHYEYDQQNRLIKETFADESSVGYNYSIAGDLKKREVFSSSDALQNTQNFSYDYGHRLTNDEIYTYVFDCTCGRLGSVQGPNGTESYEYDYKGRVKKTTFYDGTYDGTYVENEFEESAKTRTIKINGTTLFVINVDGEGRATSVVESIGGGAFTFNFSRDEMGRVEGITYPNKDTSVTVYDAEGRIS